MRFPHVRGGDGATSGAGANHREGDLAACHVNVRGQFLKLRKDVEVCAPVNVTWSSISCRIQKLPRGFRIAGNMQHHVLFVLQLRMVQHATALGIACQHAMPYLYTRTQSSDTISCVRISVSTPDVTEWSIQEANVQLDLHLFVSDCTGSCFSCGM